MQNLEKMYDKKATLAALEGDRITVGLATCGISAGAQPVYDALVAANTSLVVEKVGCIGMCYLEPLVTVVQDGKKSIYGLVTSDKVSLLIDAIKKHEVCTSLLIAHDINELDFYKKQKRIVMGNCGYVNPLSLPQYLSQGGYQGLVSAVSLKPEEVIATVKQAGIRGRGGAGFSTGVKWSFIAAKKGKKYLICNGDEGDPGAFMNRTVMESDPFKLLEGMVIGAYAIGSDEGIIYTRAEYPLAIETLNAAIAIATEQNLLGDNILGIKGFNFKISIMKGAGAFVCGEETALINSCEGKRGMPNPRPPFPTDKGVHGKPTVINNVETWTHVSTLFRIGVAQFTSVGSDKSKGTKVICLTGKIKRTGVVEVPIGISMRELVYDIGGGPEDGTTIKAVLAGGPAGGCIPENLLDTSLDYETLQAKSAIMGSGGLVVLNSTESMVDVARYFMNFSQEESCGKCTPCREGTFRLLEMLTDVTRGIGGEKRIGEIQALAEYVRDNALCGLGQNAPNPVLSTITHFKNEYLMLLNDQKCPGNSCKQLVNYIIQDDCIGCGNCARHCPVHAISGEPRKKHVINQETCVRCGKCFDVCAFNSITKNGKRKKEAV